MTNNQLLDNFLRGCFAGHTPSRNLRIDGDRLINYSTVIAKHDGNLLLISEKRYSSTTSRIQNYLRAHGANIVEVPHERLNP